MGFRGFPGGGEGDTFGPPPPPFRFRRRRFDFRSFSLNRWVILAVALILAYLGLETGKGIYVNLLWFDGAGFESVYSKIVTMRILLFLGGAALFLVFFGANVFYAARVALGTPAGLPEADAAALKRIYLLVLIAGTIFFAIIFGSIAAGHWDKVLLFLNGQSFGIKDPQFHRDISFFVFKLPALHFFQGWLMGMVVLTTVATAGLYLFHQLVVGVDTASRRQTKMHLTLLLAVVVVVFCFSYWLNRFELDFSRNGVVFGATYTDVHARLPFFYVGLALGAITATVLIVSAFRSGFALPAAVLVIWVGAMIFGRLVYPASVQRFTVQPNELEKERIYIQRNIDLTRSAYGLDQLEERSFPAAPEVTPAEVTANPDTIDNIRLLDTRPLLDTYAQIQALRRLYEFRDVDVDRYTIDGVRRQVMLSARELSSTRLPIEAQSWVNRRLQFTHGYGLVMSPVNEVVQEGLPDLLVSNIPIMGDVPVTRPEIYYGEEPEHYVIVNTKAKEFDYPVGDSGQVQTTFQGEGGVKLSSIFQRLMLAWQFGDLNIAISSSLTNDSRVLFHRNITDRIHTLAPFLTLDRDPYLVVADGQMYWIQDAYTTTDKYPYSTPSSLGGFNYIRNSVKVVVNAYDGTTTFYQVDQNDPIIKTYAKIFPKMFTPLSQMPASLRAHLRYPEDLFLSQVQQYRTYHIKDPGVLYNKEDIWNIPSENFSGSSVPLMPYYVIMRIPGEPTEEFVLILPMTPSGSRQNTIAWVAARSDGANYGKLLSFLFPTDSLVFGPQQVESRIDQDPKISAQFSLWNQSGSRVIRGNLLMIPIGNGNLFVEPIYLQAQTSQLPELKQVVVANGNHIAMEATLDQSLAVIFGQAAPSPPSVDSSGNLTVPTSPTATPVPGATATPRPPTTPLPAGTPGSVADLARQADAAYQAAQDALKNGDFTTYGQQIAKVQQLIQQIVQQTGP